MSTRYTRASHREPRHLRWHGAALTASLLTALAAPFVFLAARGFVQPVPAVLIALAFGLGSCAWPVSSQALWQHPASTLTSAPGCCCAASGVRWLPPGAGRRSAWRCCHVAGQQPGTVAASGQHVNLGAWLLLRSERRPLAAAWCGAALGMAVLCRPSGVRWLPPGARRGGGRWCCARQHICCAWTAAGAPPSCSAACRSWCSHSGRAW